MLKYKIKTCIKITHYELCSSTILYDASQT